LEHWGQKVKDSETPKYRESLDSGGERNGEKRSATKEEERNNH